MCEPCDSVLLPPTVAVEVVEEVYHPKQMITSCALALEYDFGARRALFSTAVSDPHYATQEPVQSQRAHEFLNMNGSVLVLLLPLRHRRASSHAYSTPATHSWCRTHQLS